MIIAVAFSGFSWSESPSPCWRRSWLPANRLRYKERVCEHIHYLDGKLSTLNLELEQLAGGVLDNRDAAADSRERLQRQLDARELQ